MLKKIITFTLITILILSSTLTFAVTSATTQSSWKDSLAKLESLGIVNESDLNLTGNMSREVFSKIIVNSTGNYELAQSLSGLTTFSDVSTKSPFCGYINAMLNKGYLSAMADGKFKPKDAITFAQLCTAMVKALGYSGSDIVGAWPNGYIDKARSLGLTTGFSLKSNDTVLSSAAIVMIDKMLNTNVKKTNTQNVDITLKDSAGIDDDQTSWVYGHPEVAFNFNSNTKKLGNITFKAGIPLLRNTVNNTATPPTSVVGDIITINDIKDKDVVYEVYNKLNVLIYYLVVDNKIDGQITSILPSKYSPKKIQINNVEYTLGEYAKINKFNSSNGSFKVGDVVSVVLGYDGKVVDTYYSVDDNNKEYAFVVNTATMVSSAAADYGKVYYTVELMHTDGTRKNYKIAEDPNQYRWRLVKYSEVNDDTVALLNLSYITATDIQIDRYEKKIGQSYASDNIKVFNYTDSTVSLINWNDVPNGTLSSGKVQFLGTTGEFGDINIMLTCDVFNQQYKNYVVQNIQVPDGKRLTTYSYSLVSGSSQTNYTSKTEIPGAVVGSVFSMKMYNNTISTFDQIKTPDGLGWYVQAIDSKRIKMNNWVYMFSPDVSIYIKDYSGNLTAKKIADIAVGTNSRYGSIKLYCERPLNNGGKVQAIVISLN